MTELEQKLKELTLKILKLAGSKWKSGGSMYRRPTSEFDLPLSGF